MSNVCAGIGLGQIKMLENNISTRRATHFFYKDLFDNIENVTLFEVLNEDYFSNYWLNAILVEPILEKNINSETLRLAFEKVNIETRPLWKPMHLQPVFMEYPYYGNKIAEGLFSRGLCLPSGSNLSKEDKIRIEEVINTFFDY